MLLPTHAPLDSTVTTESPSLLARFAINRRDLTRAGMRRALRPDRNFELSVFYIDSLNSQEVQDLGLEVVKLRPDADELHGWLEFHQSYVYGIGLSVQRDDNPPRHANIIGWPHDVAQRWLKAQQLSEGATLVTLNPPGVLDGA